MESFVTVIIVKEDCDFFCVMSSCRGLRVQGLLVAGHQGLTSVASATSKGRR